MKVFSKRELLRHSPLTFVVLSPVSTTYQLLIRILCHRRIQQFRSACSSIHDFCCQIIYGYYQKPSVTYHTFQAMLKTGTFEIKLKTFCFFLPLLLKNYFAILFQDQNNFCNMLSICWKRRQERGWNVNFSIFVSQMRFVFFQPIFFFLH